MHEGLQHAYGYATMRTTETWYRMWRNVERKCSAYAEKFKEAE